MTATADRTPGRTPGPTPGPTPGTAPSPHDRPPVSTSSVTPLLRLPVGRTAHERAVGALLDSYRRIPPGSTVRLAKRTSNLFRPRAAATGPGLDVAGLGGVVTLDTAARTADVQGMCTYEDLVATTLPKGLVPLVVPQLRTITLGGAVTGLGIESTSFRNGLPHESVTELDVITGAGDLVTATATNEHADLFRAFPNSYGTLGYSLRLRIELEEAAPYVVTRNVRFSALDDLQAAVASIAATGSWDGERVDFLDGVVFSASESYLVLGAWAHDAPAPSDYTGQEVYYRSLQRRGRDALTAHDYLWRWDVDWFWCSKAFGAQNPTLRRLWPASKRRSDVYHRIVALENRYRVVARVDAWRGKPARERVVQDVEVPVARTADFLRWFLEHVPMTPVWLCPLRVRQHAGPVAASFGDGGVPDGAQPWSLYPLTAGETYVNVGFWGTVPIAPGRADGDVNRDVEAAVDAFGGHKSLYSDAYYDEADFWSRYGGDAYAPVKRRYDPDGRLLDLYSKAVKRR